MTSEQYEQIMDDLRDRRDWESKISTWYNVRHTGVRRLSRPYPGAPDMHFPLADTLIEKLKGFYVQLLYATQTIASFVSKRQGQSAELTTNVGGWFDYQLKQRSNFERETMIGIDQMLQNGKCPMKVRWDADEGQLALDAVDPLRLIVPVGTQELRDADWLVHVIQLSVAEYRANSNYNQDDAYVESITGKGKDESDNSEKRQSKDLREGVGYSENKNVIILWECYLRDRKSNKITVETISPLLAYDAEPIRAPFELPFNKGLFKNGERFPFCVFRTEIKDKGYYSERGVPEIVFQEEMLLNKVWNTECTHMDFFAQPQFRMTKPVANPSNYRSRPGAVVPDGLDLVQSPPLPEMLEEQKQFARALAEYRVSLPTYGQDQAIGPQAKPQGKQTATWVNAVQGLAGVTNDVRARVFRLDLGELLNLSWSILLQYATTDLAYVAQDSMTQLDPTAIHDAYEIAPSGSADSWNKQAQMQKAGQRWQTFNGNPFVKQDELVKSILELDDPRAVERLFQDPGLAQKDQAEQQALECIEMSFGWPAQTHPSDDDATHLQTLAQFFQRRLMTGEQITPELARLGLQHGGSHDQQMQQKKDKRLPMVREQMKPIIGILTQIAGSDQMPQNVVAGPGAMPTSPAPSVASGAPPQQGQDKAKVPSQSINYKDAPPSIQRQMEVREGYTPASPQETAIQHAQNLTKAQPKAPPPPPPAIAQ
jgi:hypothetical protein